MTNPEYDHCDRTIVESKYPMIVRWWVFINRLPDIEKHLCFHNGVNPSLWAKCRGKWVRLVMASRMGHVGITTNIDAQIGYGECVWLHELTDFTDEKPGRTKT